MSELPLLMSAVSGQARHTALIPVHVMSPSACSSAFMLGMAALFLHLNDAALSAHVDSNKGLPSRQLLGML